MGKTDRLVLTKNGKIRKVYKDLWESLRSSEILETNMRLDDNIATNIGNVG